MLSMDDVVCGSGIIVFTRECQEHERTIANYNFLKCKSEDVLAEIDGIIRPEGALI